MHKSCETCDINGICLSCKDNEKSNITCENDCPEFCAKNHHIYTTSGVHPELLDEYDNLQVEDILQNVSSPFVVGIGECGLDYYYQKKNKDKQIKVLKTHIEAARISQLPLIIHSRDADEDMMEIFSVNYIVFHHHKNYANKRWKLDFIFLLPELLLFIMQKSYAVYLLMFQMSVY